jgi:hypothetical protein
MKGRPTNAYGVGGNKPRSQGNKGRRGVQNQARPVRRIPELNPSQIRRRIKEDLEQKLRSDGCRNAPVTVKPIGDARLEIHIGGDVNETLIVVGNKVSISGGKLNDPYNYHAVVTPLKNIVSRLSKK